MGSIDIKSAKNMSAVVAACVITSGTTTAAYNKFFGPGGSWEDFIREQAKLGQTVSNAVEKLGEIADNTKVVVETTHRHDLSLAEINASIKHLEKMYNDLKKQQANDVDRLSKEIDSIAR